MKAMVLVGVAILMGGCVNTPSMGRMAPVMPSESASLDCEGIRVELSAADEFCDYVKQGTPSCGSATAVAVASAVPIAGLVALAAGGADTLAQREEAFAATKSAAVRKAYLAKAYVDKQCGTVPLGRCPNLCSLNASFQSGQAGLWCGEKCVKLSRGERKMHRRLLLDTE